MADGNQTVRAGDSSSPTTKVATQESDEVTRHDSPPMEGKATEQHPPESEAEGNKPSKFKQLWAKTGLDTLTLMLMFKGSLPPTIAIAAFQARGFQDVYSTLGYLVAITSVLGMCIMPRGKFLQNLVINTFTICFAAAINLLAIFCAIKAREHTSPPITSPEVPYNSSASAVLAIWLIFQVYVINALRASRPQLQFPSILYSIFVIVSSTYSTKFPNMAYAIQFEERLLEAFLTGFAIATGVHFVVFPMSSRKVLMKEWAGYFALMGGMLKLQVAYMSSLSTVDPVEARKQQEKEAREASAKSKHHRKKSQQPHSALETPQGLEYKELRGKLLELHAKIEGDLTPAKREFAYGKLESHDLTEVWRLMRQVFVPVLGLASMINILERMAEVRGWADSNGPEDKMSQRDREVENLHFLLKQLHAPFSGQVATIDQAFQHILITLELVKPPKKKQPDEESSVDQGPNPGTSAFAAAYKTKVDGFYESKQKTLREWCHEHNVELPKDFFEKPSFDAETQFHKDEQMRQTYQRQLFFTLYLEYLLWRVSTSVLDLVLYVDKRKQDGVLDKSRLIFPGSKTLYKWFRSTFSSEGASQQDSYTSEMEVGGVQPLNLGQSFNKQLDPEHLPPRNGVERFGNAIRAVPRFLRSDDSVHGLRVAAATMTIGIVCYLEGTQDFFLEQRFLWALIMVAISMTRSSGQSILNYALRIFGTVVAMIASYIIYYIVDGKTAGVIVFLWVFIFLAFYVPIKIPAFAIVGILSLVTAILIIGYELQVKALGVEIATANGQPAYPTYELAPYRLATVAGGLGVAFIWTVFPFPISESSELRKDLSGSLYLMCQFYSIVHQGIRIRVNGSGGDPKVKGTHAYHVEKARYKTFSRLIGLLNLLHANANFAKFQFGIGGKFPRQTYIELIECVRRITMWTSLASYASSTYEKPDQTGELTQWSSDFRQVMKQINTSQHKITSLFIMLSSSLGNAQALPPYLELPQPFEFVEKIERIDRDILSIRHIAEPEYSAFAVMSIASTNLSADLGLLVSLIKSLVGEIDFSFEPVKPSSSSSVPSSDDLKTE